MEGVYELLSQGFAVGERKSKEINQTFLKVESSLEAYLARAKVTLQQKHMINPKPHKRIMRRIQDGDEEEESVAARSSSTEMPPPPSLSDSSKDLRPIRTAKTKASSNLKEISLSSKLRNDGGVLVSVKSERTSSLRNSQSTESIKENQLPEINESTQKRRSPDEGIQSARESEVVSARNSKRSNSVELISAKLVEIDITSGDDNGKMLPPPVPPKASKKCRPKQKSVVEEEVPPPAGALRITRSKIKKEKISEPAQEPPEVPIVEAAPKTSTSTLSVKASKKDSKNESTVSKKAQKKYPLPILVKMEIASPQAVEKPPQQKTPEKRPVSDQICNETFNIEPTVNEIVTIAPVMNETVTIATPPNPNATVTLSQNPHDSLMTEDNDDDGGNDAIEVIPRTIPQKPLPPLPAMKLKKNEVFNPYLSSPVKQKVQAFEKHAVQGGSGTPTKYNTMPAKYNTLKNGTPSKIGLYSKTTPLSKKLITTSTGSLLTASASGVKAPKPMKKMHSLSQESLEESKKQNLIAQLQEEKRKQREEKQRQAQQLRENMEKDKRDQALKLQQERDEKYRKLMKEKEDKQRMETLKKKMLKEKQAKKFAEEKAKMEFLAPKPLEPVSASKSENLHVKLQKQLMLDKSLQQIKEQSKSTYNFEMLHTDDSTDDESRPSVKRPSPPEWSQKKTRKPLLVTQSLVEANVLDSLFSVQPISVDLRAIFPSIDSKKLLRNSSAIWRTPPKQQH